MKKNSIILILLGIILLGFLSASFFLTSKNPLSIKELDVKVSVGDRIGMILNDSSLDYGVLIKGMNGNKIVDLTNKYDFPVIVSVFTYGELERYLHGDSKFIIEVGETKEYNVALMVGEDLNYGEHFGKLVFEFRKKEN